MENTKYLYTTGFFVDSNFEAVKKLCDFAKAKDKPLAFNLSAVFVIQFYADQVSHVLRYADFVFCNEDEGSKYAESVGLAVDDHIGAAKVIASSPKEVKTRPRIVVITMGKEPTVCVSCMPGLEP